MKILAFDTSTPYASIALWDDTHSVADIRCELGAGHSQKIIPAIEFLLDTVNWKQSDIEALAVGIGPGSFTGLRVGVATAQGLAFALRRSLYGVSSLDSLAVTAPTTSSLLTTCIDARKGELYLRVYQCDTPKVREIVNENKGKAQELQAPIALTSHLLLSPEDCGHMLQKYNKPVLMLGSAVTLYKDVFSEILGENMLVPSSEDFHHLRASSIALIAQKMARETPSSSPRSIEPIYIRPSEAEINIGPPTGGPPLRDRLEADGSIRN